MAALLAGAGTLVHPSRPAAAAARLPRFLLPAPPGAPSPTADPCDGEGRTLHIGRAAFCTHGDDRQFAPGSSGPATGDRTDAADTLVAASAYGRPVQQLRVPCQGDGTSGNRIRAYFVRPVGAPDRLPRYRAAILGALLQANYIVEASARATGGDRYLRLYTDRHCTPIITTIAVPPATLRSFDAEIHYLAGRGLAAADRKYVLFTDARDVCGLGTLVSDARPGPFNDSNAGPSWARVDRGCWSGPVVAHEIFHTLGAVQKGAPHYDGTGHCTDDRDLMCYNAGGKRTFLRCTSAVGNDRADCGGDDYFNARPRRGNYLATHWDTAASSFLYGGGPARPGPPGTPVGVTVRMTGPTTTVVSWHDRPGSVSTAYQVDAPGLGVLQRVTRTSVTFTGAGPGQSFAVTASNPAGDSAWSAMVQSVLPVPAAPTSVTVQDRTVTWAGSSPFTVGYLVYGLSADGSAVLVSGGLDADVRSFVDSAGGGLLAGLFGRPSFASYRVCAVDDAGQACTDAA